MADDTAEQMVPLSRLKAKIDALAKAEGELSALRTRVGELEPLANKAEKYKLELKAERDAHSATKSASEETLTMVSAGITDPDAQDLVRYRRGKLGEDAPSLSEYLAGGAREDRFLSSLFEASTPAAEPAAEVAPATPPPPQTAPPVGDNAGTVPTPQPSGTGRLEEIQARMSDPAWVAANRQQVLAELGFGG